ncbi:MAG: hypothetical protein ACYCXA_15440 [Actinomycetes bacterium]
MPSTNAHPTSGPHPGDRLIMVGGIIFLVGILATLITLVPFFVGTRAFPTPVYLVAVLGSSLGLGLALAGLVRSAHAQQPRSRQAPRR